MGLSGIPSVRGNENCTTQMDSGPESACLGKEIEWVGIDQKCDLRRPQDSTRFLPWKSGLFQKKTRFPRRKPGCEPTLQIDS
jgi:hypothetical protein